MSRISVDKILNHIAMRMHKLEIQYGFDPNNGYDQVKDSDFQRVMAYGEYDGLSELYDEINYRNIEVA